MHIKSLYLVTLPVLAGCFDHSSTANEPLLGLRFAVRAPAQKATLLTNIPIAESGFTGWLSITHIAYNEGARQLLFSGTVTRASDGLTDNFTNVPGTLTRAARTSASGTSAISLAQVGSNEPCNLLSFAIQPVDLTVLGVKLEISLIAIDVHGVPGPGNSLGNLLCSVTGL